MSKFWKLTNSVDGSGSTLVLDGPISQESWWGDEVTPQAFRDELKKISGNDLTVIINSSGGDVWAGVSIHDALKELDMNVTVKVSGLAASIASVIAMAGDKIIMSPGSTMMIHRASMLAMGDADDMKKAIEMLETVEEGIISIYADRSGQTREVVKEMLDAETWMSAEKAVELGFADEVVKPKSEDEPVAQNLFSGNFAFSMAATKESLQNYVDKVSDSEESEDEDVVEPTPPEEPVADAPAVEDDAEEEEEDEEEIVPPVNKVTKKEVKMTTQEKLAAGQVLEPSSQAPVTATPSAENYLKTKDSIEAFAKVLEANAGKTAAEVKAAWGEHLVTMGVTNPEILLPSALITSIEDAFKQGGEIWNLVNKTGLTVFRAAIDTVTGENSRAKGYNRADEPNKAEELITIADRVVRPQFIYKYITLNKEDIKENRDTGALVRYVLSELPRRIVREVERAIVIGDGRAPGSDYKIDSFLSLKEDAAGAGSFAVVYTPGADESKYETLVRAADLIDTEGAVYLVAKKSFLTDIRLEQSVNGGYLFPPGTNIADAFELAGVIKPDWMSEDEDNDAYLFVPSAYTTVGDNSIEAYTNFLLSTNKQEYLQEIYAGGALTRLNAGVAIAEATS